jgi:hypothetical protein
MVWYPSVLLCSSADVLLKAAQFVVGHCGARVSEATYHMNEFKNE